MTRGATFAVMILALLAACGTAVDEESGLGQSINAIAARTGEVQFVPRFAVLVEQGAPRLQVAFVEKDLSADILLERSVGAFDYWLSADGTQIIMQDGMLHSTRGIGEGLLASDLSEPLARVRGLSPGTSDRFHTYLDGNDRAVSRTYRCVIVDRGPREIDLFGTPTATRLMRESCRSLDQEFVNLYWVAPSSRDIILSRQWSGPVIGAISTRIVPR
ncbi:YjbF family lipoprotein [uncultured Tateyamaria sp.]|uniref:YjbF family lipoprotein n=1 Tax=uncultured Tateyamaria sp. TaxID=455651 RepID=UPI0026361303|nr:YjbF family lipoprotein [uncultured Tateyamaria sp.]